MNCVSSVTKMFKKYHLLGISTKFYQLNLDSSVKTYDIKFGQISPNSFTKSYNQEAGSKVFLNASFTLMVRTLTNKHQSN